MVKNIYQKAEGNPKFFFNISITDKLGQEIKQNHVECSLNPEKAESRKGKEIMDKCNEQKTVADRVAVNCINKYIKLYKYTN